jgi:peptidylamidoglycolate lyase
VENAFKKYTLGGEYLDTVTLPGAYICRPVIQGKNLFFAVLVSKMPWDSRSGFVLVLNEHDQVISAPGGNLPTYHEGKPDQDFYQTIQVFKHPHDVLADADQNLYVAQWNSDKVYPARLERV